jgi:Uma2 family endonuclease
MGIPIREKEGLFTYRDYLSWPEGERWELINGVAYDMSPAPSRRHQGVLMEFSTEFSLYFRGHPCSVYFAPFDVILPSPDQAGSEEESDTVVQPDLIVVCDPSRLTKRGCTGAPDFVLEILSPSTAFKDMEDKLKLYERHGVREYWVLNPANDTLLVYAVPDDPAEASGGTTAPRRYRKPVLHTIGDVVAPRIFPELTIDLTRVFDRDREG